MYKKKCNIIKILDCTVIINSPLDWLPYLTCPLLFFNFISQGKILKQKKE